MNNNILVTGGLGFIGQFIVKSLVGRNFNVKVLDNLSNPSIDQSILEKQGATFIKGDIKNRRQVHKAVINCNYIIHLAAQTNVQKSIDNPYNDLEVNGIGTLNLLEAARQNNVKKIIVASSNAVAGNALPPFRENTTGKPISHYACSKQLVESYCNTYQSLYGLDCLILRFSNVYGPGSIKKGSVVSKFLKNGFKSGYLTIFGDGEQTRDFLYIDDLTNGVLLSIKYKGSCKCFCLGSGNKTKIIDVAKNIKIMFKNNLNRDINIEYAQKRSGDIIDNWSDIKLANTELNYFHKTSIKSGLEKTFEWFESNINKIGV